MMNKITPDIFDGWLTFMDEYIEDFKSQLPKEVSAKINYTSDSLDVVENWILGQYATPKLLFAEKQNTPLSGIVCYVGETFRINLNGIWQLHSREPNHPFDGLPVIEGFSNNRISICPSNLLAESIKKRVGWYMRATLKTCIVAKES